MGGGSGRAGTVGSGGTDPPLVGGEAGSSGTAEAGEAGRTVGVGGASADGGSANGGNGGRGGSADGGEPGECTFEPASAGSPVGSVCGNHRCGNGIRDGFEECDDGNADETDDCTSICVRPLGWLCEGCELGVCGNGVSELYADGCGSRQLELCDDGNTADGDGCDSHCQRDPTYVCPIDGEPCRVPACGDGYVDSGFFRDGRIRAEECDDALDSDCEACVRVWPCGNGWVEGSEQCDDHNQVAGDGCSPTCRIESRNWSCPSNIGGTCSPTVCGDGVQHNDRETCDDGNQIPGDGCSATCEREVCVGTDCWVPRCGDGYLDGLVFRGLQRGGDFGPEACDDGNQVGGDGCSADCVYIEQQWICSAPGTPCAHARCGDGVVTDSYEQNGVMRTESCDDGNDVDGDGCDDCYGSKWCKPHWVRTESPESCPGCGNGQVEPGEACDDGNEESGDGCVDCEWEPEFIGAFQPIPFQFAPCGNGVRDHLVWNGCTMVDESCDDGNLTSGDGCSERCELEPYFMCALEGGSCAPASCRDGIVNYYVDLEYGMVQETVDTGSYCSWVGFPHENVSCSDSSYPPECNDFNSNYGDGCTPTCKIEPGPWVCPRTGTNRSCHRAVCGDGTVENFVEQCDDGNVASGDGCSADCVSEIYDGGGCHAPLCGNGVIEDRWNAGHNSAGWVAAEPCDDGNAASGDGCSEACMLEFGFVCGAAGVPCAPPRCGDGVVTYRYFSDGRWHLERCDDGNDVDCDGCTGCLEDSACNAPFGPLVAI